MFRQYRIKTAAAAAAALLTAASWPAAAQEQWILEQTEYFADELPLAAPDNPLFGGLEDQWEDSFSTGEDTLEPDDDLPDSLDDPPELSGEETDEEYEALSRIFQKDAPMAQHAEDPAETADDAAETEQNQEDVLAVFAYRELSDGTVSVWIEEFSTSEDNAGITVPETIGGKKVSALEEDAFSAAGGSFTKVTLPDTLKVIGNRAFYGCSALNEIELPGSLKTIGEQAFFGCMDLKELTVPKGVDSIGNEAFSGSGIAALFLETGNGKYQLNGGGLYEAGGRTLLWYPKDGSRTVQIPEGTTGIADGAFRGNTDLQKCIFPDSVTSIGASSFEGCTQLMEAALPSGMKTIGTKAFYGCRSLREFMIPRSLNRLGDGTFACSGVQTFTKDDGVTLYEIEDGVKIYRPSDHMLIAYACGSRQGFCTVKEGISYICGHAFEGAQDLIRISFAEGCAWIGEQAFAGCTSLRYCYLPESVLDIMRGAFENCTSLEEITLPEQLQFLQEGVFRGCSSLKSITVPLKTTVIAEEAFSGCSALEEITLPAGLYMIGRQALDGCLSLKRIELPAKLTEIAPDMLGVSTPEVAVGKGTYAETWAAQNAKELMTSSGDAGQILTAYVDKETIRKVQEALKQAGYDCGKIDGINGMKTQDAIRKYRKDHELPDSVEADDQLLQELGLQDGKV